MDLNEYSKKRNFKETPEPPAEVEKHNLFRFVVQRHQASHLHYDLRLELDGVLKSWAVPKGPSMEAGVKRLAVQTEDHPVKYITFEGRIPKGNYGAGEMTIWDTGIFKAAKNKPDSSLLDQWKKGNIKLVFEGEKLKGEFALVRTGQEKNWLLIKKDDAFSTKESYDAEDFSTADNKVRSLDVDEFIKPMLASPKKEIFNNPDWIYELKWDGYRMISSISNGKVKTYSRNGNLFTQRFSAITQSLEGIPYDVILDGEVVAMDKNGMPDFQALQNYPQNNWKRIEYHVFDILHLNGHSTMGLPLMDRKSLIPDVISGCENVFYTEEIEGMGTAFYQKAIKAGMEGVVAKKADSVYVPGYRSENWLKIKAKETQETLICGYTESDAKIFGSLILGILDDDELRHIGNCGSGFSHQLQKELKEKFKPLRQKENPFREKINLKGREPQWLKPELIAEVSFSEWTKTGKLRHPVFKGLREDKGPKEAVRQEEVEETPKTENAKISKTSLTVDGYSVPFSNLEKIYFPETGLRKYDLIEYYIQVSEVILPYLTDRPQSLRRHPNGITSEGFFQKNISEEFVKPWMETVGIFSESNKEELNYLLCQNEATLLYMANLGCIELNSWNSRISSLDQPDYAIIDLDPSKENTFEQIIETALAAKEVLDKLKVKAVCKTSGSAGIHILIPMGAKYSYDQTRDFTKWICLQIQEKLPDLTTLERTINKRNGKIYLDFLQNRRAQTLAAPYCVRPKEGAPVSAPLEWKEVKPGLQIQDFTIQNMPDRIRKKGDIWKNFLNEAIDMEKVLSGIG